MNRNIIILNAELEGLGEVRVRDGEFASVTLTQTGEGLLGPYFEEWQTQGLPALRTHITQAAGKISARSGVERVQLRSSEFENSFGAWLSANGYFGLTLSDAALEGWYALCQLPLDSKERLMMALAFRDLHPDHLPSWIKATENLVKEIGT